MTRVDILSLTNYILNLAEHEDRPFVHLLDSSELLQFETGVYRLKTKGEIAHAIENIEERATNNVVNEVFDKLKRRSLPVHIKDFDKERSILNVKNCLIDLSTGKVMQHDPDFLSLNQLEVEWDPQARSKRFERFIERIWPDPSDRLRVLDMFAACLWRRAIKKELMLVGDTDSGKSTYLAVVGGFLGVENVSNVSLQELDADKFAKADLLGKLANIHADIDDAELTRSSAFKTTNGGDRVRAQHKFGHAFNFVPYAKKLYSCNHIPVTKDEGNAFFNRWIIVSCNQRFVEPEEFASFPAERVPYAIHMKDIHIIDKLLEPSEKSGILNILISRAQKVVKLGTIPNAPSIQETREAWLNNSDFISNILFEMLEGEPEGRLTKVEVYQEYVCRCKTRRITPKSKQAVNARIEKMGAIEEVGKLSGRSVKRWKGIKWKANTSPMMVEPVERKRSSTTSTEKPQHLPRQSIGDEALVEFADWQGTCEVELS